MEIMHTMSSEANAPTPKRRNYSPALKAQVVAQCRADGASIAAVSFPQRLSQGDVKEFIKLKTARARYGV